MNIEAVWDTEYWKNRLAVAQERHHSIYLCDKDSWIKIEALHRDIIHSFVAKTDSVLDAGCGYGRLLNLMPKHWKGDYLGIDLSPDFIELAKHDYPRRQFQVGTLEDLSGIGRQFDWAISISVRPMIRRHQGGEVWDRMREQLKRVTGHVIYLEYDLFNPLEEVEVL